MLLFACCPVFPSLINVNKQNVGGVRANREVPQSWVPTANLRSGLRPPPRQAGRWGPDPHVNPAHGGNCLCQQASKWLQLGPKPQQPMLVASTSKGARLRHAIRQCTRDERGVLHILCHLNVCAVAWQTSRWRCHWPPSRAGDVLAAAMKAVGHKETGPRALGANNGIWPAVLGHTHV